jgi:transcriptional regulator with XRE-family HTH domain
VVAEVPKDADFGERLKNLRKRGGLTQKELAAKLGLHPSLIAQYEGGYIRLHAGLIVRLCRALHATPNELLGVEAIKGERLTKNRRLLHRLKRVDELAPADQRSLLRYLDALLNRPESAPRSQNRSRKEARSQVA